MAMAPDHNELIAGSPRLIAIDHVPILGFQTATCNSRMYECFLLKIIAFFESRGLSRISIMVGAIVACGYMGTLIYFS
jgi:hypothetical protein